MSRVTLLLCLLLVPCLGKASCGQGVEAEVSLSLQEIGRLNIFEDRWISEADALFAAGKYDDARVKYGSFLDKHPDSPAAAYALLRKGRSAELAGQLADAMADYESLATRFAESDKYAAPALYYLSAGHRQRGNTDEAKKARARLTDNYADSPFAKQPAASPTGRSSSQSPTTPAASPKLTLEEYERIALSGDPQDDAVAEAIGKVVKQHVRTVPDEAKLREFYSRLYDVETDLEKSLEYWLWVAQAIQDNSTFSYYQRTEAQKFFKHWLAIADGKFPESDDMQIAIARMHYGVERDRSKLAERLDTQYKKGLDPEAEQPDWRRTLKWVAAYKGNYSKTREYVAMFNYEMAGLEGIHGLVEQLCEKQNEGYLARSTLKKMIETIPFSELTNDDILALISLAHETANDVTTARALAEKLDLSDTPNAEKLQLAREFLLVDGTLARQIYNQLDDPVVGKLELFQHYVATDNPTQAIALAGELAQVEELAEEYSLKRANLLMAANRLTEAIVAYRECGNTPAILWKIVACHEKLGATDRAIEQLRALELTHKSEGPKAAMRVAALYGEAEDEDQQIAALKAILKKYPNSKEAKEADGLLGDLGVPPALPTDTVFDF